MLDAIAIKIEDDGDDDEHGADGHEDHDHYMI